MAFKTDNRTAAERAEDRSAAEAEHEAQSRAFLALVNERRAAVKALEVVIANSASPSMTEWEISFVRSLAFKTDSFDESGTLGGRLADLMERQVTCLEQIAKRHVDVIVQADDASERRPEIQRG